MNIYVGNLALEMTGDELRKEFARFGEVKSVTIMDDRHIGSGQPRGYGYVEMASRADGAIAIARLEGKKVRHRVINVVEALALSERASKISPCTRSDNRSSKKRERA